MPPDLLEHFLELNGLFLEIVDGSLYVFEDELKGRQNLRRGLYFLLEGLDDLDQTEPESLVDIGEGSRVLVLVLVLVGGRAVGSEEMAHVFDGLRGEVVLLAVS